MDTLDLRHLCAAIDREAFSGPFSLRRLDVRRDLDLVPSWMTNPSVARFWRKPWPRVRIASYLRRQDRSTHSAPYLGELDGAPMSYCDRDRARLLPHQRPRPRNSPRGRVGAKLVAKRQTPTRSWSHRRPPPLPHGGSGTGRFHHDGIFR